MEKKKTVSQTRTKLYIRTLIIVFFDIVTLSLSGFVALWVRFDFSINQIPANFLETQIRMTPMVVASFLIIYYFCKLYHSVWRFASVSELSRIVLAYVIIVPVFIVEHLVGGFHMPRSTYLRGYPLFLPDFPLLGEPAKDGADGRRRAGHGHRGRQRGPGTPGGYLCFRARTVPGGLHY